MMENDEQAESAILEAIRSLKEMHVQLNEVTVPMKAAAILQDIEPCENSLERIQTQLNRMLLHGRLSADNSLALEE
jgi:uncharacterized protein Yka (UPF0111/DUF47 family)